MYGLVYKTETEPFEKEAKPNNKIILNGKNIQKCNFFSNTKK